MPRRRTHERLPRPFWGLIAASSRAARRRDGARLDAIAFRTADTDLGRALLGARGKRIHAAGRLRAEEWNGRVRVQLHLDDAAPADA